MHQTSSRFVWWPWRRQRLLLNFQDSALKATPASDTEHAECVEGVTAKLQLLLNFSNVEISFKAEISGLGCLSRHPYFLRRHEPCSSVHSLSFTKHQGYRMSTATPLDQSLQRTISTLNLQTIKEDMEDKELLIIKDQKHSALKATLASKLPRASTEGQDRLMDQRVCSASLFEGLVALLLVPSCILAAQSILLAT